MNGSGSSRGSALPPDEILQHFLASHGFSISLGRARAVCAAVDVVSSDKVKKIARRLETELASLGIKLKHTHALEVVSRMAGHGSYIHALKKEPGGVPIFSLYLSIEGESVDTMHYGSIGDAITVLLETAIRLMPERAEPSLCTLTKLPSGLNLDVRQAKSSWFELFLACFREDSLEKGDPVPVWLDHDELRAAFRRLVHGLEQARPAILVKSGGVPLTVEPWCKAWFRVTSAQDGTLYPQYSQIDEEGLFRFFDSEKCDDLEVKDGCVLVKGSEGVFRLESRWMNVIPANRRKVYEVEAEDTGKDAWRRFLHYRKAIVGTVANALDEITGEIDSPWFSQVSDDAIYALMQERGIDVRQLALKAGVRYRDVKSLDSNSGFATPALVLRLARALEVEPDRLLVHEESFATPVTNANVFIRLVSGASDYLVFEGRTLEPEERQLAPSLLSQARDVANRVSRALRANEYKVVPELGPLVRYKREVEDLLEKATSSGILFVLFHEVRFARSDAARSREGEFRSVKLLHIHAERLNEVRLGSLKQAGF